MYSRLLLHATWRIGSWDKLLAHLISRSELHLLDVKLAVKATLDAHAVYLLPPCMHHKTHEIYMRRD